jgi:subfamily B ATP-binding cassette protein MsbA
MATSILESVGLLTLWPLFEIIISGDRELLSFSPRPIWKIFINTMNSVGDPAVILTIILLSSFLLKALFSYASIYMIGYYRANLMYRMKVDLKNAILNASIRQLKTSDDGYYNALLNEENNRAQQAYQGLCQLLIMICSVLFYFCIALYISTPLAAFALFLGISILNFFRIINNQVLIHSVKASATIAEIQSLSGDLLSNFRYFKATKNINFFSKVFDNKSLDLEKSILMMGKMSAITTSLREPISLIAILLIILIGSLKLDYQSAQIFILIILIYRISNLSFGIQKGLQNLLEFSESISQIFEQIELLEKSASENLISKTPDLTNFNLSIKNDYFILDGSSFKVQIKDFFLKRGDLVCIDGPSGAGKTTFIETLLSLRPLGGGTLRRGDDIKVIGYVSQKSRLLTGTAAENLFGSPLEPKYLEHYSDILDAFSINKIFEKFEKGYNTHLAHGTTELSGGEIQLVLLAREFIRNPDLLILDEVSSALDKNMERKVMASIKRLSHKKIIVFISHNEIFKKIANKTYKINNGELYNVA